MVYYLAHYCTANEELHPSLRNDKPPCEKECVPYIDSVNRCFFGNPSNSDSLAIMHCLCAYPEAFKRDLLRCSTCLQTVDDSNPAVKALQDLVKPQAEHDLCKIMTELSVDISSPTSVPSPTASPTFSFSTASHDLSTANYIKESKGIPLFDLLANCS